MDKDIKQLIERLRQMKKSVKEFERLHNLVEQLQEVEKQNAQLRGVLKEGRKIVRASSQRNLVKDWDSRATAALATTEEKEPTYTTGHCSEKAKPGGCTLHNLHCGYPACDRKLRK